MLRRWPTGASVRFFSTHDYQFLHRSSLPMLHFQRSLPRLPIPELGATCERYLAALRPLLTADQHSRTAKLAQEFQAAEGRTLQERLKAQDAANQHTSYISEPWFDMYLSDRAPLPVNYTPLLGMKHTSSPPAPVDIQLANILVTTARFMRALRAQMLSPEVFHMRPETANSALYNTVVRMTPQRFTTYASYAFKSFPLDMSQYQGLFSATRIPQLGKDAIWRADKDPRHVLVLRRGNLYRLDIMDKDGNIEAPGVILSRVKHLLATSQTQSEARAPLGIFTTQNRDTWAELRSHLETLSENNKQLLRVVDSAIICVCLDDIDYAPDDVSKRVTDYLFSNAGNRWFDKSLSVILSKDSRCAVTFEHSWGDGVAVLRYFNELYSELSRSPLVSAEMDSQPGENFLQHLNFDLDTRITDAVEKATQRHQEVEKSLAVNYMMASGVGRSLCKAAKVSPDAVAQLAIQLAYAQVSGGGTAATYESCSTSAFRCGRTETVRPATDATKRFCQGGAASAEKVALLRECSDRHNQLTREAAMGQGFDRHLFALRRIAEEESALYKDTAYKLINHNILSTSTLSSPALEVGGFGPVVADGYGIGYQIDKDRLGSIVSTYHAKRNGSEFVEALQESAKHLKEVLEHAAKGK
ncbi:carnitine O-palmitoyltransferase 2, mitochondrial [Phlebotomus argentipes]|uniref:carnitine O-palmitoyltransferase 2, mitochondrial n=1 Tax=Phlebotomus argentipes TaxID=94469 RepID=UPI0028933E20|nr:carnitine O-palmitoyltransferase 2, mitochondrial [Phlebotomus argentipes]